MNIRSSLKSGFALLDLLSFPARRSSYLAIAIPNFIKARTTSQQNACINNLRQIDGAIQPRALANNKTTSATVAYTDISPYLKNAVTCPSGGTTFANSYTIVDVATKPVCKKIPATHALPADTAS